MEILSYFNCYLPSTPVTVTLLLTLTTIYFESRYQASKSSLQTTSPSPNAKEPLTALQSHVLFFAPSSSVSGQIYPSHIYTSFRSLGFSIPFSLSALLIPIFFSYPTRLAHSWIPDPWFGIYVSSIHKAKHGSDTGVYDLSGNLRGEFFEGMFVEFDSESQRKGDEKGGEDGSLGAEDLWRMVKRNRVAADVAGWSFAVMEWGTTWLLLQRNGRVWKTDLMACYDGSIFWEIRRENLREGGTKRGYGLGEFWGDVVSFFRRRGKRE